MATRSNPGGLIPSFLSESSMPSKISQVSFIHHVVKRFITAYLNPYLHRMCPTSWNGLSISERPIQAHKFRAPDPAVSIMSLLLCQSHHSSDYREPLHNDSIHSLRLYNISNRFEPSGAVGCILASIHNRRMMQFRKLIALWILTSESMRYFKSRR